MSDNFKDDSRFESNFDDNEPEIKKPDPKKPNLNQNNKNNFFVWLLIIMGLFYLYQWIFSNSENNMGEVTYKQFYNMVANNSKTGEIVSAKLVEDKVNGVTKTKKRFSVNVPNKDVELIKLMREQIPDFDIQPPQTLISNLFYTLGPMVLFIAFLWFFVYRGPAMGAGGGKILSFGKSRAKLADKDAMKITFNDVAGIEEAKEELKEVVEFLKDPKKFQKLGGKMPKGVLLMGPPGTGKTLLAKAVAGEAGVPFFSISGSDFVEMFVGVGASRVRDLFDQAKRTVKASQKGCILFIDEIDAVGRQRFAGIGGGHDEREQTLNALLAEMDGFDTAEGVILIAATNRPDVLDAALLRPGRFDRQIVVDRPDVEGRKAILAVHAKKIKLAPNVDLENIARQTTGFSGADLANLINEAAILGARRNKEEVGLDELQESMERVMAGPERRSRKISDDEKKIIAYHESGHAIMSYLIKGADPLHKVAIISRGLALGYTIQMPRKDQYIYTESEFIGKLCGLLGGRVSEELIFDEVSTGAQDDIRRATELARDMVTMYGMSKKLGHLTFGRRHHQVFLGRDISEERNYSEDTARLIDDEVKGIVDRCYETAKEALLKNKDKLKLLADRLIEKETLNESEVRQLLGFPENLAVPKVGASGLPI
ncbi:MAG: ATP-dependent zinc metalloprotease FtsH [Candidatus Omnitrophica bacterium]|nr:ATP-dependent zinc metalloprotease FtsH [Candidatus Omnitrophota bacterium]